MLMGWLGIWEMLLVMFMCIRRCGVLLLTAAFSWMSNLLLILSICTRLCWFSSLLPALFVFQKRLLILYICTRLCRVGILLQENVDADPESISGRMSWHPRDMPVSPPISPAGSPGLGASSPLLPSLWAPPAPSSAAISYLIQTCTPFSASIIRV